jgi:hypothetical protein
MQALSDSCYVSMYWLIALVRHFEPCKRLKRNVGMMQ